MNHQRNADRLEAIYCSARDHHRPRKVIWRRLFKARNKALREELNRGKDNAGVK